MGFRSLLRECRKARYLQTIRECEIILGKEL